MKKFILWLIIIVLNINMINAMVKTSKKSKRIEKEITLKPKESLKEKSITLIPKKPKSKLKKLVLPSIQAKNTTLPTEETVVQAAPNVSTPQPSDVAQPDVSTQQPSDVSQPDISTQQPSDVVQPDVSTQQSDVSQPVVSTQQTSPVVQNQSTSQAIQPVYNFNFNFGGQDAITQFCPFLADFQNFPTIPGPSDVPTDTLDNLQNFITNLTNTLSTLKSFITNYANQVNSWQANNPLQNLKNLITTMNNNNKNYTNTLNAHQTCVNNAPAPVNGQKQSGCNAELLSFISATNALYDSFADIINFLNIYQLAPTWANPLVRVETASTFTDTQGNTKAFTIIDSQGNNTILQVNSIKGFNSGSFVNQINIGITYLQNQLQGCYDGINQLNNAIKAINNNIKNISTAINTAAMHLQRTGQASPSQAQQNERHIMTAINDFFILKGLSEGLSFSLEDGFTFAAGEVNLEMPALIVFTTFLNELAAFTGSGNDPMSKAMAEVSAQTNKLLLDSWGASDWSGGHWAVNIGEGLLYTGGIFLIGIAAPITTLVDTTTNLLSGQTGAGSAPDPITQASSK